MLIFLDFLELCGFIINTLLFLRLTKEIWKSTLCEIVFQKKFINSIITAK